MSIRKISIVVILSVLVTAAASAAENGEEKKQGPSITAWLKSMQRKIESIVPRKSLSTSTGVAGVRGAREDAQTKLYWKGKKGEENVAEDELKDFQKGIDLAARGDAAGATRELEGFLKQHPDSPLVPDAKKTLELVKQEQSAAAAPEKKEQAPAETPKSAATGTVPAQ